MTAMPNELANDVLNSLMAHIAVLDERGVIIAVNDAWTRFGAENGARTSYVGADYLAVCEHHSHILEPEDKVLKFAQRRMRSA